MNVSELLSRYKQELRKHYEDNVAHLIIIECIDRGLRIGPITYSDELCDRFVLTQLNEIYEDTPISPLVVEERIKTGALRGILELENVVVDLRNAAYFVNEREHKEKVPI